MNNGKIGVFIVERQELLREGLLALLAREADVEVMGASDDLETALSRISLSRVDVLLIDISVVCEQAENIVRDFIQAHPESKIIALANQNVEMRVLATLARGVAGYVLKHDSQAELMLAIRSVTLGKTYLSPAISQFVVSAYLSQRISDTERRSLDRRTQPGRRTDDSGSGAADALTYRERQIITLIAQGSKNKEIARTLSISPKTVEKHRANLMKKLGCHSSSQLTVFAMENGLVGPDTQRNQTLRATSSSERFG